MAAEKELKNLCVRVSPKLHKAVALAARKKGVTIQQYVTELLEGALKRKRSG